MALHENEGYDPTIGESEALEAGKPTKEYQYNLMYLEYGKTKPEMIYEDVIYLAGSNIGLPVLQRHIRPGSGCHHASRF